MRRSPWATLVVLALAQFMVVLDVTIVNVALPDMQVDLGFSPDDLQWVISAYTLAFGGFLLLGGRLGDLLGRRRVFAGGLALFTAASLAGGLASSQWFLVGARAIQGFGGALMSAAALSILTVTYAAGRSRNIAMGIWGGLAGLGGTLGVVAGGVLVDAAGWEWVFFVNVPIGVALLVVTPTTVADSRVVTDGPRSFDLAGAALGTGGVLAVIYGVIRAEPLGWSSAEVIASLVAGAALLALFVVTEARSSAPLVPLRLFRSRTLSQSTLVLALNGGAFLAMFFLSALFLQQGKGLTALETGLQFLPMGVAAIAGALVATQVLPRVGTRPTQVVSAVVAMAGLLLLTRASADGSYVTELLPGFVLYGAGIMGVGVPAQIIALSDVAHEDAGAASGLINTGYQVGGALGLAVISTLATSAATSSLAGGADPQTALAAGYERGLLLTAALGGVILLLAAVSRQLVPSPEEVAELAAAA
ncbi:DHA2 family efflux MFS transporter permease subunit [Nocardioides mangrovi]|uniref:DHA2 family efflux MFS transporter permease subunit n=1 Tax=Nocardioides mangrovi TaxID=2874580 RepID=A0ABS7UFN0_9ACTN|nr:DHA2 family efflux MFS transporter permease subunit [Nocardioides mangrovi]MBZ5739818.1 DHA2 family efflux MFS transporter permease subunit [Nocardioides mangrovi]